MKRWIVLAALGIAAALVFASLRECAAPVEEEIDDASKQALGEILRQEEQ